MQICTLTCVYRHTWVYVYDALHVAGDVDVQVDANVDVDVDVDVNVHSNVDADDANA